MGGKPTIFQRPSPPEEDGSQPSESLQQMLKQESHHSEVICWGAPTLQELGMGTAKGPFRMPLVNQLLRGIPVRQLHAGAYHTYITTEDKKVYSYGWNAGGQCGVGSKEDVITVPTELTTLSGKTITLMASGAMHGHFVTADREFWSVGSNSFGQVGNDSMEDVRKPVRIDLQTVAPHVRLLACGDFFTIAIIGEKSCLSWGRNNYCQTGQIRSNCIKKPEYCSALNRFCDDVVLLACGSDHTVVLTEDGDVSQFGSNMAKQFGQALSSDRTPALTKISLGTQVVHLAASGNVTVAYDSSGNVHMWGSRHTLYNGSRSGLMEHPKVVWRAPEGDRERLRALSMGRNHLHLLTRSGLLYTWVFAQWKKSPSPFLPQLYWDLQNRISGVKNSNARSSIELSSNSESQRYSSDSRRLSAIGTRGTLMDAQLDDALPIQSEGDSDAESFEDVTPHWMRTTDEILAMADMDALHRNGEDDETDDDDDEDAEDEVDESESANDDSSINGISETGEDEGSVAIGADSGHNSATTDQDDTESDSDSFAGDHPPPRRAKLPPTPWKSYFVGTTAVKSVVCGAFTTQILLFGNKFSTEFLPLALRPEDYFADRDIFLSDQSTCKIHSFIFKIRCPALLTKRNRKFIAATDAKLIRLIVKNVYCEYCHIGELSDEELVELRKALDHLEMKKSELHRTTSAEIAFRAHQRVSADISYSYVEQSMRKFKTHMRVIYEKQIGTDHQIIASKSMVSSTSDELYQGDIEANGSQDPDYACIYVHRAILAIRCPFFEALFRSSFAERIAGSNTLDCTVETLDHLLRYIYYNFTSFSLESATWILTHASLLFVDKPHDHLQQACIGIMRRAGRKTELKRILQLTQVILDPYEHDRESTSPEQNESPHSDLQSVIVDPIPGYQSDPQEVQQGEEVSGASELVEIPDRPKRRRRRTRQPSE